LSNYTIRHDEYGHATAIEREGYTVLHLLSGTERNEQEVEGIVRELNGVQRLRAALASLPDKIMDMKWTDTEELTFPLDNPTAEEQSEWLDEFIDRLDMHVRNIIDNEIEGLSTTTESTCKCGRTGGYNLKFGQLGEETFPCEVCSADFFKPTGTQRVREAIADRYKNALHGWYNPVDRAACSYYSGYLNGVSDTLRLLGITIPGINAPEGDENDA